MHKYMKYPLKWALRNKLRSLRGKPASLDKKWCDVGQDPMQGDLRENSNQVVNAKRMTVFRL